MNLKQFLEMIAGPDGTVHLRTEAAGDIQEFWVEPSKYSNESMEAEFEKKSQDEQRNMWFQVSTVKSGSKSPLMANVVWADVDVYKYPGGELQVMGLLRYLPKPTVIVRSGRGLHIYWKLKEPVPANGPMSLAQILAKDAQWKLGADACHAPNKLLRIPGTYNFKPDEYEGGKLCELIAHNDVEYSPEDFNVDETLLKVGHKLMVKIMLGPTEAGEDRSEYDFHCAAELFKTGFNVDEIKHLMRTYPFSGKIREGVPSVENYIDRTIKSAMFRVKVSGDNIRITKKDPVAWVGKSLVEILAEDKPPFVIQDFLPTGGVAMISAPPKARKSWAVMQMAYSVATGSQWLGFDVPEAKKVMYVQAELPNWIVAERFKQMYGDVTLDNIQFFHVAGANLLDEDDMGGLLMAVDDFKPDLVIIDPVANFWQGDENSSSSVNQLFDQIARLQALKVSVVMVHHSRKTEQNERLSPQHQRGSNVFFARPDAVMTLSPMLFPGEVPHTWAAFSLRAAEPKDDVKLFTDSSGKFTTAPMYAGQQDSPVKKKLMELMARKDGDVPPWEEGVMTYG